MAHKPLDHALRRLVSWGQTGPGGESFEAQFGRGEAPDYIVDLLLHFEWTKEDAELIKERVREALGARAEWKLEPPEPLPERKKRLEQLLEKADKVLLVEAVYGIMKGSSPIG